MLDTEAPYVHLCHPDPVSAADFLRLIASKLNIPAVHIDEWMDLMVSSHAAAVEAAKRDFPNDEKAQWEALRRHFRLNPAARIIPFFRTQQETSRGKPLGAGVSTAVTTLLTTDVAVRESKTLRDLKRKKLGDEDIERWFAKWREVGMLPGPKMIDARL